MPRFSSGIDAVLAQFPFVVEHVGEAPIHSARVLRMDEALLDMRRSWAAMTGNIFGLEKAVEREGWNGVWSRILLFSLDGHFWLDVMKSRNTEVSRRRWLMPWRRVTRWKEMPFAESVWEAANRLPDYGNKIGYIVTFIPHDFDKGVYDYSSGRREFGYEVIIYKLPQGYTFAGWVEKIRAEAQTALTGELAALDEVT